MTSDDLNELRKVHDALEVIAVDVRYLRSVIRGVIKRLQAEDKK